MVLEQDRLEIIANDQNNKTTSCVTFTDSERLLGDDAKNQVVVNNPVNTVDSAKKLIGTSPRCSDTSVRSDLKWPFKFIMGPDGKDMIVINIKGEEKHMDAEEISAMILIKMREHAEAFLRSH